MRTLGKALQMVKEPVASCFQSPPLFGRVEGELLFQSKTSGTVGLEAKSSDQAGDGRVPEPV